MQINIALNGAFISSTAIKNTPNSSSWRSCLQWQLLQSSAHRSVPASCRRSSSAAPGTLSPSHSADSAVWKPHWLHDTAESNVTKKVWLIPVRLPYPEVSSRRFLRVSLRGQLVSRKASVGYWELCTFSSMGLICWASPGATSWSGATTTAGVSGLADWSSGILSSISNEDWSWSFRAVRKIKKQNWF